MTEIKLGNKVECIYTGFKGTAVARTEFINGCIMFSVLPKKEKKDNKMPEEMVIDEKSLKLIGSKRKEVKKSRTGGPMRKSYRRNF